LRHLGRHARFTFILAAFAALAVGSAAQASPTDAITNVGVEPTHTNLPSWLQKMAGSSAELGSYIGSGTFYTSGYSDPYVSTSLYLRPTYDLGTRFKLAATGRFYFEEEFTKPDNVVGRRFYPYDGWLSLAAKELRAFTPAKLTLGGLVRVTLPLSYESHYAHLVTALTVGPSLSGEIEFGRNPAPERRFRFSFTGIVQFTKYLRTSDFRGNFPGDTTGCRQVVNGGAASTVSEGPTLGASDRCGGPVNANFGLRSAVIAALSRGRWSLGATFLVDNTFLYDVPHDSLTAAAAVDLGREDTTWGIIGLTYAFTDHFAGNVGVSSQQPALDAESRNLRFPFFDFSGANYNNYTQAFVSLTGTL
jgi:hypothetical protein